MELKKYNAISYGKVVEEMELKCTNEEYDVLREFLEHVGVNLCTSVVSGNKRTLYVRNPYKEAVGGWGSDLCKKMGDEFFDRGKRM